MPCCHVSATCVVNCFQLFTYGTMGTTLEDQYYFRSIRKASMAVVHDISKTKANRKRRRKERASEL